MKRGQGSAETVILLLAFFIAIYVLLIPPCDRCKLVNADDTECDDVCEDVDEEDNEDILISEKIGGVSDTGEDQIDHELDDVNLFLKTEPEIQNLASSLYITRTSFGTRSQDLTFRVDDLENLKSALLSFSVSNSDGQLFIELNENIIFSGFISSGQTKIVHLPISSLNEQNRIKIYVSSPGIAFWRTNRYTLNDLVLKKEFEEIHSSETRNFVISSSEEDALEESTLKYSIYCNELSGTAYFKIYLNNEMLTTYSLGCVTSNKRIEIDIDDFEEGENELKFVIDNGDFLITNIEIINNLDEEIDYIYDFDVSSNQYDSIVDGDKEARLELELGDGKKKADIILNDNKIVLSTSSDEFEKDVSSYITEGTNIIEIIPETDFEIERLIIELK